MGEGGNGVHPSKSAPRANSFSFLKSNSLPAEMAGGGSDGGGEAATAEAATAEAATAEAATAEAATAEEAARAAALVSSGRGAAGPTRCKVTDGTSRWILCYI